MYCRVNIHSGLIYTLTNISILFSMLPLNERGGMKMKMEEVIKEIKYRSDLNQSQMAEILGCSQVSVSRIRRGIQFPNGPLLMAIMQLAKKYKIDVKIDDLLPPTE